MLNLKKEITEISRDIIAFGSIPFYIIVFIRTIIGEIEPIVFQLLAAFVLVLIFTLFVKEFDAYVSRAFILTVLISILYQDILFTLFAFILFIFITLSSYHIKGDFKSTMKGVLVGIVSTVVTHYMSKIIF